MINWNEQFDKIYCIVNKIGTENNDTIQFQLKNNNIKFEYQLIYQSFYEKSLLAALNEQQNFENYQLISEIDIIKKAFYNNYQHILILNNNTNFDLNKINSNNLILNYQYDMLCLDIDNIENITKTKNFILTKKGMDIILRFLDFNESLNFKQYLKKLVQLNFLKIKFSNNTQTQLITKNTYIKPIEMNVFLAVSMNVFNALFPLLYSMLKYSQSKFNVYIMLNQQNVQQYYQYFNMFKNTNITITLLDNKLLKQVLNKNSNICLTEMTYARMLIPILLPNLDRVLYLDFDTLIINKGIQWLYNIDFQNNYIAAFCRNIKNISDYGKQLEVEYTFFSLYTNYYFNAGVLLFNNKKIIEDGYDKIMLEYLKIGTITEDNNKDLKQLKIKFPTENFLSLNFADQSLLNYIFKNKVLRVSPIFNSSFINNKSLKYLNSPARKQTLREWNFNNEQEYVNNIIIAHYGGSDKPWNNIINFKHDYQKQLHMKYRQLFVQMRSKYKMK